jgi:hypothetical protein
VQEKFLPPPFPVRLCILHPGAKVLRVVADYSCRWLQSGSLGVLYAQGQIGKGVSDQLLRHGLVSTFPLLIVKYNISYCARESILSQAPFTHTSLFITSPLNMFFIFETLVIEFKYLCTSRKKIVSLGSKRCISFASFFLFYLFLAGF